MCSWIDDEGFSEVRFDCALLCTMSRAQRITSSVENNNVKRIMLLVFLIVSLVELNLEPCRLYLLCSIASLLLVFGNELKRHRKVQKGTTERVIKTQEGFSSETYVAYSLHLQRLKDRFEKVEPTSAVIGRWPS